jgi:hypothetical protein
MQSNGKQSSSCHMGLNPLFLTAGVEKDILRAEVPERLLASEGGTWS